MFTGWTESEIREHAERLAFSTRLRELRAEGLSLSAIAAACNSSIASVHRWLQRREEFDAGTARALLKGKSTGRTPLVVPTENEAASLRRIYVQTNRTRDDGSKTMAARLYAARSADCSEDLRAAILKPRASKHTLTTVIRRAMDVPESVRAYHRNPKDACMNFFHATRGMSYLENGQERPLRSGMAYELDDGSINLVCTIPWIHGGCRCSDKWGVKVGRFQLLAAIDIKSRFRPGFQFVMRPLQSYRAADVRGFITHLCRTATPRWLRLERGSWEANEVELATRLLGIEVVHVFTSNGKPYIEGSFSPLWTALSTMPGQIGRFRGEMREENLALQACQEGRRDPRRLFPTYEEAVHAIEQAMQFLNTEPVESKKFGKWVPQERWNADFQDFPRPAIDASMEWVMSREIKTWTVRKGQIGGQVPGAAGVKIPFAWHHEELLWHEGRKVQVFFDPMIEGSPATLVATEAVGPHKAGQVIAQNVKAIGDIAQFADNSDCWDLAPCQAAIQAMAEHKRYANAVRTEYRELGMKATRFRSSRVDGANGNAITLTTGPAVDAAARSDLPPIPNPQYPISNCQSPIPNPKFPNPQFPISNLDDFADLEALEAANRL
jgi:transposase